MATREYCTAVLIPGIIKEAALFSLSEILNSFSSAARPCKKPLSPSCSVQLADTRDSPAPIPLLAAALGADSRSVLLAYGNHLQPVMERAVSTDGALSVMAVRKKLLAG